MALADVWLGLQDSNCRLSSEGFTNMSAAAEGAADDGAQLAWDSQLYISGDRAAVLAMAAYQAQPGHQGFSAPTTTADDGSCHGSDALSEPRPGVLSVLFSDSRGGAVHMTVPSVPGAAGGAQATAGARLTCWQPHGGR